MTTTIIDDFSAGIYLQAITVNTFAYLEIAAVFKGFRKTNITKGGVPALFLGISGSGFTFQSAADQAIQTSELLITYDGNNSQSLVDLSAKTKFKVAVLSQTNQEAGAKIEIELSDNNSAATVSQPLPDNVGGVIIENAIYSFDFVQFAGIDFASLKSIKLKVINAVSSYVAGAINLSSFTAE